MKLTLLVFAGILVALMFTGCNSCSMRLKNLESDMTELDRDIVVLNPMTGDTVFKFSGPCYFDNDSSGGVTLIYKKGSRRIKADFHGNFLFYANEI